MWLVLALILTSVIPPAPSAQWHWPTTGNHDVLRDFRAPLTPWGAGHRGLDLAASSEAVFAPTSGRVSFSGWVVNRPVVTITTDRGHRVSLEPVSTDREPGSRVKAGEPLGLLHAGHCASLCVHIGLRIGDHYRSPKRELGILERAVLLPW